AAAGGRTGGARQRQDAARARYGDPRRRRAALRAPRLDARRRHPRLRALSHGRLLRHHAVLPAARPQRVGGGRHPRARLSRVDAHALPGWDLQALRDELAARAVVMDVSEALTRWQSEGREGDARDFIDWVLATQVDEQVMVTEILPSRLIGARTATFSTDATVIAPAADAPGAAATVITTP